MDYLNRKMKDPVLELDENGKPHLTHDFVVAVCEYNEQFRTPNCVN